MNREFEVIVIGGGHAGCEAAHASAQMGRKTALFTLNPDRIGYLSCNPAVGGLAKGQLVKEIDALGGIQGLNTDHSAIQYKRLNTSKGPAVRSSRAQCDKGIYSLKMKEKIYKNQNITVIGEEISDFIVKNNKISRVVSKTGSSWEARAVILTSGTFLSAIMFAGEKRTEGGRHGDAPSNPLSSSLKNLGFSLRRLKTGTPPRLDKNSIEFEKLVEQWGDERPIPFSFYLDETGKFPVLPQVACHLTETNEKTHDIIRKDLHRSPMFSGAIQGVGPRYCPSIEDKIFRFKDKTSHQIFLEPEGLNVNEIYVNGVSTSLPADTQEKLIHSISGLENARFLRHGYAVEYDSIDSRVLTRGLESKDIKGLYFAGQVNGTSGYEEAAAQGLIAGINAALSVREEAPFILDRGEAYIGVLIDDLTLRGSDEPYRMFTSRAEYRLLLREDTADQRLSSRAYQIGLLSPENFVRFQNKSNKIKELTKTTQETHITPTEAVLSVFAQQSWSSIKDKTSLSTLLRRPEMSWEQLGILGFDFMDYPELIREQVETEIKYDGYIRRDLELLDIVRKNDAMGLSRLLSFDVVPGLSNEIKGLLRKTRPETLGQAARIPGVTPAAVANLYIYLRTQDLSAHG